MTEIDDRHRRLALQIMGLAIAPFVAHIRTASETGAKIAQIIAEYDAQRGVWVDAERVWDELYRISMEKLATNCASGGILISKNDLAAALQAAKEQGK